MLVVETPFHGMICNRHDGRETPDGLRISVAGRADAPVTVDGRPAAVVNGRFSAEATLNTPESVLTVRTGAEERRVAVLYDRRSVRRARFSIDDNILLFRDIALNNRPSIFDNDYLAFFRSLHLKYGARFHFNVYFQDNYFFNDFTLEQMPDRYKSEWRDNASWIRLTFHALADQPDCPYAAAGYDVMRRDCERVTAQIVRFAGEELLSPFTTVHWGAATRDGCRALRDCGFRGLAGYFIERDGRPIVSYHVTPEQQRHLFGRDYWKDPDTGLLFIRHDMVVNSVDLRDIVPQLDALAENPHLSEVIELMIHEQYFHPRFCAFLPDARERTEAAVRWITEHGYRWAFYEEGFLGA